MLKLHLGCGQRNFGTDWRHIDMADYPHIDSHDVTKLPYVDGAVDLIYSSHLIAYFDREEIIPILQEWERVLRPGGILRLATPDWDVLRTIERPLTGPLYGKMHPGIYHKTVYGYYDLYLVLRQVGFIDIGRWSWEGLPDDHSQSTYDGKLISLNVECTKP